MSSQPIADIARRMAYDHFDIDESIEVIIWFKDEEQQEIHLVEVSRESPQEDLFITLYHAPTPPEYPLPAYVVDLTPEEWEKVKQGKIELPEGWSLDNIEVFDREETLASFHAA